MAEYMQQTEETTKRATSMNPKKFALWLFMVSVVMIFASLTSAYIVRQAEGNWYIFDLPFVFYVSSIIIVLSSATMHWAVLEAKKDNFTMLRIAMSITAILGLAFLVLQYYGWVELVGINVYFGGSGANPSGSFVYVLTGLHGLHLVSGVIFILWVLSLSFRYKIHSKNLLSLDLCATFWHFLDGLWIYLFVFLLLNR